MWLTPTRRVLVSLPSLSGSSFYYVDGLSCSVYFNFLASMYVSISKFDTIKRDKGGGYLMEGPFSLKTRERERSQAFLSPLYSSCANIRNFTEGPLETHRVNTLISSTARETGALKCISKAVSTRRVCPEVTISSWAALQSAET